MAPHFNRATRPRFRYQQRRSLFFSGNTMTERKTSKPIVRSVLRGLRKRCPNCGEGRIFGRYLKPTQQCERCHEPYDHIRTDDFAPWLTIIVLGHFLVPGMYTMERLYSPPLWVHGAVWGPFTVLAVLLVLPHVKGACLGLMWALGLRGDERQ